MLNIQVLKEYIEEWISHIEINPDKFHVEIIPQKHELPTLGVLHIKYLDNVLCKTTLYKNRIKDDEGKNNWYGRFHLYAYDEGKELFNPYYTVDLDISESGDMTFQNQHYSSIKEVLNIILPLSNINQVNKIIETFDITPNNVLFDTYLHRYVINNCLPIEEWTEDEQPTYFFKYISLDTFINIIEHKSFRLNSIISQSDTTETFYLGDFLSNAYEDEFYKFRSQLSESNFLITSFTTLYDDYNMWKTYGDNGKGVLLIFKSEYKYPLHQVQYVNESKTNILEYREKSMQLKEEGIHIHFSEVDNYHHYVKNDKFQEEKEWRLVYSSPSPVSITKYGDRIVFYRDFKFDKNTIPELGLELTGIDVGPNLPNGTTNFPGIVKLAYDTFGPIQVNRSRLKW